MMNPNQSIQRMQTARELSRYRRGNVFLLLATAVVIFIGAKSLRAQTTNVYWDGDTNGVAGGTGSLNTTLARFSTNGPSVGGTLVAPTNGNYILNFGGTAGTVTQSSGTITNSGLNWLTTGYTFTVGANNNRTLLGTNSAAMYITNNANLNIGGSGNASLTLSAMNLTGGSGSTVTLSNALGETFGLQFGTSSSTSGRTNSVNTIINGAGTVNLGTSGSGGFLQSGNITNNSSGVLVLSNSSSGDFTVTGAISGSGAVTLLQSGSGNLFLNTANSYSGGTTILHTNSGYVGISNSAAFGSGTVTIAGAGTNYIRNYLNNLNVTNAIVISNGSTLRLATTNSGWKGSYSGVISGGGGIIYQFTDTQILSNTNNSFGGGVNIASSTTVQVGSLGNAGANSSLGTNGTVTFSSISGSGGAGELDWMGTSSETSDKNFALTSVSSSATTGMKIYAGTSSSGGTNVTLTLNGNINSTGATNMTISLGAYNTNTLVMNGTINQAAGYTNTLFVGNAGAGTVVLGGTNNSFGGAVTLSAASSSTNTLQVSRIGNAGANSSLGTNGTIHIGNGTNTSTAVNVLKYAGSGETSDKVINLAGATGGATLDQSGSGNLKLTSAMTATGVGAKTLALQGSTSGTGELAGGVSDAGGNVITVVKNGSGKWTLSGANSYSGTTTVNGGTLEVSGSSSGNGANTINGGTMTISGTNTGSGNTTINSGTLAINGVKSGSGTVLMNSNTSVLQLGSTNALVNGVLLGVSSAANAPTVELTSGGNYSVASMGNSTTAAGYMNFTNSSGAAATLTFTAATNTITSGGNGGRTVGNLSTNLTVVFNGAVDIGSTATNDVTFNTAGDMNIKGGVINNSTGVRGLTKSGVGTLTLEGNNNYNGATVINAGTLATVGNERIVDGTSVTIASNAVLKLGGNETVAAVIGATGSAVNLQNNTLTVGGTGSDFTNTATVTGSGGVVKNGAGLMYLNNSGSTYSGGMTLNAGDVAFTASGNYGAGVVTSSVFGTGVLTLNGGILRSSSDSTGRNIANSVVLGGDVQLGKTGSAGTLTFNNTGGGTTTLAQNITLTTVADVDYVQSISGASYSLTKSGAGVLNLEASNNIAQVIVNQGGLGYRNRNSFGNGVLMLANGVQVGQDGAINNLNLTGNSRLDRSLVNDIELYGNVTMGGFGSASYLGGNLDLLGDRVLTLGNTTHLLGSVRSGGLTVDNGAVDGTSRTLNLMASNSYAGGTVVRTNAALAIGHDSALGTGSLVFTNTSGAAGVATLRASTLSTAANQLRTINNNIQISSNMNVQLDAVTTAQDVAGVDATVRVDADLSGAISGSGGLTKTAANTVTLRGVNSYSGTTTVNDGTLVVASGGSISSSSATVNTNATLTVNGTAGNVTVNSGGTLKGSGTVGALEIASGGTLAVGNSPGSMTASSATWNGGGSYDWEINNFLGSSGSNWDFLNVTGALTINASANNKFMIDVISLLASNNTAGDASNFNLASNYTFAIATAAGGISGFDAAYFEIITSGFSNSMTTLGATAPGYWTIGQVGNSINLSYNAAAIPEPATGSLLVVGLVGALAARRFRRS